MLRLAEDPDRAWPEYGGHLLPEARAYASWQSAGIRSAVRSAATTVAELRAEGVYRILTPCLAQGLGSLVPHPPAGGMPVEEGRRSLRLFAERVVPTLGGRAQEHRRPRSGRVAWTGGGGRYEERAAGSWPFSPSSGSLATRLSPSPPGTCPSSP
ncbi:hypothetical protein SUDANB178_02193 [Streptomyces sp. enrichment culture]